MRTTTVGGSGLRVSQVALGCAGLGSRVPVAEATRLVSAALELGMDFFDTADVYGDGESERALGRALGSRRDECVVATKFRHLGPRRGASRKSIRVALDGSLRRLGTDYVDLYQLHAPDPATPVEETVGALQDLVQRGKILYYGLCNVPAWQVVDAQRVAWGSGRAPLTGVQAPMNLVDRRHLDELRVVAGRFGVGLLAAAPLARGLLGGRYDESCPPPADHPLLSRKGAGYWTAAGRASADRVRKVAAEAGLTPAQTALAALLACPEVAAVLVGATCVDQLREWREANPDRLTSDQLRYLSGPA